MNHSRSSLIMIFVITVLLSLTLSAASAQEDRPIVPDGPPMTAEEAEFEARQAAEALAIPPPEKPALAAVESEITQTASPPPNKYESEFNGNFATADPIEVGDVIFGTIKNSSDQDFFAIYPAVVDEEYILVDIDAQINGSKLDAVICVFAEDKDLVGCNDDSDGLDSLLYLEVFDLTTYYVRVEDFYYPMYGGDDYYYTLSVSHPWLISASKNGKVEGMKFRNADVLAWQEFNNGTEKWSMFFDASDMGVRGDLEAVGRASSPTDISIVLDKKQTLYMCDDLGYCDYEKVTPHDIIGFRPHRFGPNTSGEFYWIARGADYCMTKSGEKIDAIADSDWTDVSSFSLSTTGRAKVCSGEKYADEDIFWLDDSWSFDGSQVPGLVREDIVAAYYWIEPWRIGYPYYYLTIKGKGKIHGNKVDDRQVFSLVEFSYDWGGIVWDGRDHNFNYPIDAISR